MIDLNISYDNNIFLNKTSDNNIYLTQIKGHSKLKIIKISYNKNITLKIKTKYPIKLLFNKEKIRINNIKKISLNKNNVFSIKFINPEKKNKIKISKIKKKIIISYAVHINFYDDFEILNYCLDIISKKCKMICISYSLDSSLNENEIKNRFKLIQNKNKNLKIYNKVENKGRDFYKHFNNIMKIKEENIYNKNCYILLMNDTVIPINSILFNNTILKIESLINEGYNFIGLLKSYEIKIHYQSWFWCCDKNTINIILKIFSKIDFNIIQRELAVKLEFNLSNRIINKKKMKSTALYDFNIKNNLFYHHNDIYIEALNNGFPFLKKNYFTEQFRKKNKLEKNNQIYFYLPKTIINYLK